MAVIMSILTFEHWTASSPVMWYEVKYQDDYMIRKHAVLCHVVINYLTEALISMFFVLFALVYAVQCLSGSNHHHFVWWKPFLLTSFHILNTANWSCYLKGTTCHQRIWCSFTCKYRNKIIWTEASCHDGTRFTSCFSFNSITSQN